MIDVMVITYNESINLPHCLRALEGWTRKVFVIDSGSTDGTQDIARSSGAEVVEHAWEGYARQKNWGLANLPFDSPWILILDADEVITAELRARLDVITTKPPEQVLENGFFINRMTIFMGKPIRHCGYFPSWNMRLFKRGQGIYEDREVHEHIIIEEPVGYIKEPMLHHDRRGLEHYVAKHNRYSSLEARTLFEEIARPHVRYDGSSLPTQTRRHRWLKRHLTHRIPFPGMWRFLYMYLVRLGVMHGSAGLAFCRMIAMYDSLVALKLKAIRRAQKDGSFAEPIESPFASNLAVPEGADRVVPEQPQAAMAARASISPQQLQPEASPWSFKEKLARAAWMLIGRPLFRMTFHNWHRLRASLLGLFGATIGERVAIRPSAHIEIPWMLEIDDDVTIGDHAIIYSLGSVKIGKRSIISQYAHLCAGTHDYSDHTFRLIRAPVILGDDVWIGADAFIGPGVTVGSLSVVGARSSTYKDLPAEYVCVGNPARPIKKRILE